MNLKIAEFVGGAMCGHVVRFQDNVPYIHTFDRTDGKYYYRYEPKPGQIFYTAGMRYKFVFMRVEPHK